MCVLDVTKHSGITDSLRLGPVPCLHSYALRENLRGSLQRHSKIRILTKDKVLVVSHETHLYLVLFLPPSYSLMSLLAPSPSPHVLSSPLLPPSSYSLMSLLASSSPHVLFLPFTSSFLPPPLSLLFFLFLSNSISSTNIAVNDKTRRPLPSTTRRASPHFPPSPPSPVSHPLPHPPPPLTELRPRVRVSDTHGRRAEELVDQPQSDGAPGKRRFPNLRQCDV